MISSNRQADQKNSDCLFFQSTVFTVYPSTPLALRIFSFSSSLCLGLFLWAEFKRAKGGVKVHVLLDHDDYMPSFVRITSAKKQDSTVAGRFNLKPGSIVAFDRAYNDYTLFSSWTEHGVFFVTRQKENAVHEVVENRKPPYHRFILSDEIIRLTGPKAEEKCPHLLRRVVVWDRENDREIVLLTNNLDFGASTITAILSTPAGCCRIKNRASYCQL